LFALFGTIGIFSIISAWLNVHWYLSLPIFAGFCAFVVKMNRTMPTWVLVCSTGLLAAQLLGWKVGVVAAVVYWVVTGAIGWGILMRALKTRTGTQADGQAFMKSLLRMRIVAWSLGIIAIALFKAALMLPQT
jgi:hypothetical protein